MSAKKYGLGRGLEALLGEDDFNETDNTSASVEPAANKSLISVADIVPCPFQPRGTFDEDALQTLSDSIRQKGLLQPLLLRRKDGKYEIVAGERRWRAAVMAGLSEVPAVIKDLNDKEVLEIALIENIQRENLSPLEEAGGFDRLMKEYGYTQEALGQTVGKSRSYIANSLRLLGLPQKVKDLVNEGKLSAGHARALVGHPDAEKLAEIIVRDGLSVREAEKLAAKKTTANTGNKHKVMPDADLEQIISDLERKLSLKVAIKTGKNGKGSVTLKYESPAELSSILDLLEQR